MRYFVISTLVYRACLHGLKPYRNEASASLSGCDAVVVLLAERNMHLSYDAVANAWKQGQQEWMRQSLDERSKRNSHEGREG